MSSERGFLDDKIHGSRLPRGVMPERARDGWLAAVELVDNKMREIAQRTRSTIAERVAVMAAPNIAHEYFPLQAPRRKKKWILRLYSHAKRRIAHMGARIRYRACAPATTRSQLSADSAPPPAERPLRCLFKAIDFGPMLIGIGCGPSKSLLCALFESA